MAPKTPATGTRDRTAATRDRIIFYLEENRTASVQVLSRAWGLTRADIRYHFNALLEEDVIERVPRDPNQPARRGRPEQCYRLAANAAPDNFPALCAALLDTLLAAFPGEEREAIFRALAARLAEGYAGAPGLTQRFNQASAFLSQHGYRARWEAHASGPRILLRTCPYAAILPEHPELCALDRSLLEHLVQLPLEQTERINLAGGKTAACVFISSLEG